jgi:WD40 repeat protein/serine/threonine protein kinase
VSDEYRRDYLIRLPLPLAQLYNRAYNAKDPRGRHDNAFYLFEALVKLAVAPAVASYLQEVGGGAPRVPALDRQLAHLALPSLGQWLGMLRELARHFGQRVDAAAHPLGHVWSQLDTPRRDLPGVLALYRRIKNGPDGQPAGGASCSLLQLLDALVQYRNGVFGHGAARFESFYEQEMGPLLFPAANEVLAEGVFDLLGPRGTRLVYLTELRTVDENQVELSLAELVGAQSERTAPLTLSTEDASGLVPNCVAILWPGRRVPMRLDPLLVYRAAELSEEVLFLNRDRNARQVEYLSYTAGRPERDRTMAPSLARLLSQIVGREVGTDALEELAAQSFAETPSVEALFAESRPAARVLGDYEILAELGRGGMGVVYLVRQLSLGRVIALKMLPADLAADEVALARFRREIRALARCDHPNIVKVLSTGTMPDGQLYYAMEYVPGADLEHVWRELSANTESGGASTLGSSTWSQAILSASRKTRERTLRRSADLSDTNAPVGQDTKSAAVRNEEEFAGRKATAADHVPLLPLPELPSAEDDPCGYVRRVATLIRDAARAVDIVHKQGIIHRDIKPANLMLTPDGSRVVLMDFGLAKGTTRSLTLGHQAGFLGTLRYAAPEQLAAASLDVGPPADVRALGVTTWELLTRRRLFEDAEDEKQLATAIHEKDVPRLRSIDPAIDSDLEAIVSCATEKHASDRIQTAGELADYLELYLNDKPLPIRTPSAPELLRRWVREHKPLVTSFVAAFIAVVVTIVIAFVMISDSRNKAREEARQKAELADEQRAAREDAESAKRLADQRRREVERHVRVSTRLALDRGLRYSEQGEANLGILWLTRSLEMCLAEDEDLERAVRLHLMCQACLLHPLKTLIQFDGWSEAVGFSPDGSVVAAAQPDGTVRLWDVESGEQVMELVRHTAPANALAFSQDGKTLVTGSHDHTAIRWDLATGNPSGPAMRHDAGIWKVAFSPDQTTIATGSLDQTVRLWDARTGKLKLSLRLADPEDGAEAGGFGVDCTLAFSPRGDLVAAGSYAGGARVWNTRTGQPAIPPLHADPPSFGVEIVEFSPDGALIATASHDDVCLWNVESGSQLGAPFEHEGSVEDVAFSADSRYLATGTFDGVVRIWDVKTKSPWGEALRHEGEIQTVAFSPDGELLLSGSKDGKVRLWTTENVSPLGKPLHHESEVWHAEFDSSGNSLLTLSQSGLTRVWSVQSRRPFRKIFSEPAGPVAVSGDGTTLLVPRLGGSLQVCNAKTGDLLVEPIRVGQRGIVEFSKMGKRFLIHGSGMNAVQVWDADSGKPISDLFGGIESASLTPDGDALILLTDVSEKNEGFLDSSGKIDPQAVLAEVLKAKTLLIQEWTEVGGRRTIGRAREPVFVQADGRMVAGISEDGTVKVWRTDTGESSTIAAIRSEEVDLIAISPTGEVAVTAAGDTAWLWDVRTGNQLAGPLTQGAKIERAAFSGDGRRLLVRSADGIVRIWHGVTDAADLRAIRLETRYEHVSLDPSWTTVVGRRPDGVIELCDASTGQLVAEPIRCDTQWHRAYLNTGRGFLLGYAVNGPSRLWETQTGNRLEGFCDLSDGFLSLSSDWSVLITAHREGVHRWELPRPLEGGKDRLRLWANVVTGMEMDDNGVARWLDMETWRQRRDRLREQGGAPQVLVSDPSMRFWDVRVIGLMRLAAHHEERASKDIERGDLTSALGSFAEALAIRERLAREYPDDAQAAFKLARAYASMATTELRRFEHGRAVEWMTRAVSTIEGLDEREKLIGFPSAKDFEAALRKAREASERTRRIVEDFDFSQAESGKEISSEFLAQFYLRAQRGAYAPVVASAERLTSLDEGDGKRLFIAACGYAMCVRSLAQTKADSRDEVDRKRIDEYTNRAFDLLKRAEAAGFTMNQEISSALANNVSGDKRRRLIEKMIDKVLSSE